MIPSTKAAWSTGGIHQRNGITSHPADAMRTATASQPRCGTAGSVAAMPATRTIRPAQPNPTHLGQSTDVASGSSSRTDPTGTGGAYARPRPPSSDPGPPGGIGPRSDGPGYLRNFDVVLSARTLPPVWQVGQ